MARQFRSRRRSRTRWVLGTSDFLAQGAGTGALTVISAGAVEETILRVRGELLCQFDSAIAPPKAVRVGVGMIIMPEGQGTTVVSSSLTDGNAPWLWLELFHLFYEEPVTDVIGSQIGLAYRAKIDSKAMRILRPDREVQMVFEQATINGAQSINLSTSTRFLMQHSG